MTQSFFVVGLTTIALIVIGIELILICVILGYWLFQAGLAGWHWLTRKARAEQEALRAIASHGDYRCQ